MPQSLRVLRSGSNRFHKRSMLIKAWIGASRNFARPSCSYNLANRVFSTTILVARNHTFSRTIMTTSNTRRITDDLEKPSLDDRAYRYVELPNKLQALLVHDSETDKASASMNVNVGSFSDDREMPGMAHAVEHLLFMGTKKVRKDPIR